MDIKQLLDNIDIENVEIEFKHENEDHTDIVKELTAFANSGGGAVIVGVAESENSFVVTGVENPQKIEEDISQVIDRRVSPRFNPTIKVQEFEEKSVVTLEVSGGNWVHSYGLDKSYFPARQGSTTIYLDGRDLRYRYQHQLSADPDEGDKDDTHDNGQQDYRSLESTYHWLDHGPHLIPKPAGKIASVCTFGELYLPSNPVRISARANRPTTETVEHILACLAETFQLDNSRSHFTINQNRTAWIGSGLSMFFEEIDSQQRRYANAGLDTSQLYKCEEALYVANTSIPYPESLLLVYVEPWVSENFARHFEIVLLTNGMPVDTEPLTDFGNLAGIQFGTAESVEMNAKSLSHPEEIPFSPIERIRNGRSTANNGGETIGFLAKNPFYDKGELASRLFEIEGSTPLAEFQYTFGHFLQLPPEELPEITPDSFRVVDYSEFAAIPLNAIHVDFQLTW